MQNDRNKIEDRTIEGFVSRRWAEAKDVVRQLDPEFVSGIEAAASLSNSGVWVPQIDSKKRLQSAGQIFWKRVRTLCGRLT